MPTLTIPYTHSPGQVIKSAEVNANNSATATLLNTTKLNGDNIQTGGIPTEALADVAVTAAKLATDAVTTAKITDDCVTEVKLNSAFKSPLTASNQIGNLALSASVASSALTIAVKTDGGTDASAIDPIKVGFRSATATSGVYNSRSITGALSVVVSSGSTLGHSSGNQHYIFVYLLDNSGTPELAVSSVLFDDGSVQSTTAEGGAGAADSNRVLYSTTARTNVPIRLIARMKSTQTTAGTWAVVPTEISLAPFEMPLIASRYSTSVGTTVNDTTAAIIPYATKVYDTWNAWSSDNTFTCPRTGFYQVTHAFKMGTNIGVNAGADIMALVYVDGVARSRLGSFFAENNANSEPGSIGSALVHCTAGQTIQFYMVEISSNAHVLDGEVLHNWAEVRYVGAA